MANIYYSNERKKLKEIFGDSPFIMHETYNIGDILATPDSKITPGTENNNNNWDFHDNLPYVYFSLFDVKFINYTGFGTSIIFSTNVLTKQKFWCNKDWQIEPTEDAIIETNENKIHKLLAKKIESIKKHEYNKFAMMFEVFIEKSISIKNAFAIILPIDYDIEFANNKIISLQNKIKKYDTEKDKKKIDISKNQIKQYKQFLVRNQQMIDFCKINDIVIIYKNKI
jgi:hypothetical protein